MKRFGNVKKNEKDFECKVNRDGYKHFTGQLVHREIEIFQRRNSRKVCCTSY